MIYINKTAQNVYVELDEALDPESNFIGETWEDYEQGAWLLLSEEQVKFHEENPKATVTEVWNKELTLNPVHERTVDDAKYEMLRKIADYDTGENVNRFTINGEVGGWFTPNERSNYKSSIDAAKLMGVETLSFYVGDILLETSTDNAERMLAMIQLYADRCFIVTKQHRIAVEGFADSDVLSDEEKITLIDSYDFMSGYPEKLNFEL